MPWRPVEIEQRLLVHADRRVVLTVTAGTTLSVLPTELEMRVRIGAAFLYAPEDVLEALGRWARRPQEVEAAEVLARFLGTWREGRVEPAEKGVHDLVAIRDAMNARFFEGRVRAHIGWSRSGPRRRRRSILFGSYYKAPAEEVGTIRIHPALDQDWVPRGFVEFVVHHEMLHAVIPARCVGGRRTFHPPEFRRRERSHPEFVQWIRWERENLSRFLKSEGA